MTDKNALIAVTAATGNIGHVAVERLLSQGFKVRAIARTKAKLDKLKAKGAEPVQADLHDAAALEKAFKGARSVFLLIPPSYAEADFRAYQRKLAAAMTEAVKTAGVKHVVLLSSVGAQLPSGTGPIAGLHELEETLKTLGVDSDFLRPGYFFENHLMAIGAIKGAGAYINAMGPGYAFPQIATRDIGEYAAARLAEGGKGKGVVHELFGPKEYSMADAVKAIGGAIGKPDLKYVQASYDDARKAMTGMGLSENMADTYIEMMKGFNEGKITGTQKPSPERRGKTTLEQFVKDVFTPAFKA